MGWFYDKSVLLHNLHGGIFQNLFACWILARVHGIVESEELMAGQDSSHDQKPLVLLMFFS